LLDRLALVLPPLLALGLSFELGARLEPELKVIGGQRVEFTRLPTPHCGERR